MSTIIEDLKEFIVSAEKSRKYPVNTAISFRTALKYFEAEMNEEEKNSFDLLEEHFEPIYQAVFNKNKIDKSVVTIATYRKRMRTLLNDYKKYGIDPTRMTNWTRATRPIPSIRSAKQPINTNVSKASVEELAVTDLNQADKLVVVLNPKAPERKASISIPIDLTDFEAERLKKIIDSLVISSAA